MVVDLASMISLTFIFLEFSIANMIYIVALITVLIFVEKFVISIFKRYKGNRFEFELKFLLLLFLGLGIIAEEAGFHAAIIAFIVGIIFSDIEKQHMIIIEKLDTVVFSLLAPIFFFHAGSLIALRELTVPTILIFFVFLFVAVIAKFFGTYLSIFMLFKKDTVVAKYGGIIFNYRLSFGIVTGMYAYDMNFIDIQLLNVIFLIVALSSIFSVFLEKRLEKEVCLVKSPSNIKKPEVKPF
jgi:Kef-type K+ transport system membrane component KefB